jgi:hypothetical protein
MSAERIIVRQRRNCIIACVLIEFDGLWHYAARASGAES